MSPWRWFPSATRDPSDTRRRLVASCEPRPGTRAAVLGTGSPALVRAIEDAIGTGPAVVELPDACVVPLPDAGGGLRATGHRLPFEDGSLDLVACERLLHLVAEPGAVAAEARRVLAPGGRVLVVAEPDHHAVVEHPAGAGILGLVAGVLRKRGAHPDLGRGLRSLFPPPWRTRMGVHGPAEGVPDAPDVEALVEHVSGLVGGAVPDAVVERWQGQVRAAARSGVLLVWLPHFWLVARLP